MSVLGRKYEWCSTGYTRAISVLNRPGRPKGRTAVFGQDGGPYRVRRYCRAGGMDRGGRPGMGVDGRGRLRTAGDGEGRWETPGDGESDVSRSINESFGGIRV